MWEDWGNRQHRSLLEPSNARYHHDLSDFTEAQVRSEYGSDNDRMVASSDNINDESTGSHMGPMNGGKCSSRNCESLEAIESRAVSRLLDFIRARTCSMRIYALLMDCMHPVRSIVLILSADT